MAMRMLFHPPWSGSKVRNCSGSPSVGAHGLCHIESTDLLVLLPVPVLLVLVLLLLLVLLVLAPGWLPV